MITRSVIHGHLVCHPRLGVVYFVRVYPEFSFNIAYWTHDLHFRALHASELEHAKIKIVRLTIVGSTYWYVHTRIYVYKCQSSRHQHLLTLRRMASKMMRLRWETNQTETSVKLLLSVLLAVNGSECGSWSPRHDRNFENSAKLMQQEASEGLMMTVGLSLPSHRKSFSKNTVVAMGMGVASALIRFGAFLFMPLKNN